MKKQSPPDYSVPAGDAEPEEPMAPMQPHAERSISSDTKSDYAVGYGRPPKNTQFKKGQSGNPRGRKKGLRNVRTVVESELNKKIPLRQGDKLRAATKLEAFALTLVDGALKREPKAVVALITLLRSLGLLGEDPEPTSGEPVTVEDDYIVADFLRRHSVSTENVVAPEESINGQDASPGKEKA